LTPSAGVTVDSINKFKSELIQKLLKTFTKTEVDEDESSGFMALAKLCSDNSSILKEDSKSLYLNLLQNFVKKIVSFTYQTSARTKRPQTSQITSPTADRVKLLLMTLKDAKKLNLNDEMKGSIVDTLLVYLKAKLLERMSSEVDDYQSVEVERQMFAALKPFKANFQENCLDILRKVLVEKPQITSGQLQYSFKIYQVAFDEKPEGNKIGGLLNSYIKFHDEFAAKALALSEGDKTKAIVQIIETNNAMLTEKKYPLQDTHIDDILAFLSDPRTKPSTTDVTEFCKFYTAVGESLFIIANVRQNYFNSRLSQFFSVYRSFLEAVYFFKNDEAGEITPMETSLLLILTLQLEK
jgi:hypothetical protein